MTGFRFRLGLLAIGVAAGYTATLLVEPARAHFVADAAGCRPHVVELLHFGLEMPGGARVDTAMWEDFLAEDVSPRFPEGFTALEARGQWRDGDGTIVREPSRVLEIVHSGDPQRSAAIRTMTELYKARFHQQSVMRLTLRGEACF